MTYWDLVANEIKNQHLACATFCFAHRRVTNESVARVIKKRSKRKRKKKINKYYLGPKYPNVTFTHQEAKCMQYALKGKSIPNIAKAMKLSNRTVEFYFCKMRDKLGCFSKSDLIERVAETDFLKKIKERKAK